MSTLRTISGFKERLAGGGARPNLFEVELPSFPAPLTALWKTGAGQEVDTFKFMCKAATLPASTIAEISVPFRGRNFKVAGDRTFDPWSVTIMNDEDFKLRTAFELWMNSISKLDNNTGATNPGSYMTDAYVHQLGRGAGTRFSTTNSDSVDGTQIAPLRTYKFYDIFPTNVGEISLSYDSTNEIEEYTVDFQIQYWTAGEPGDATGTVIA